MRLLPASSRDSVAFGYVLETIPTRKRQRRPGITAGWRFPAFTEFRPDPAIHDPKQLVVWNIEGEGRLRKFRALYQGENVADAFNTAWAGKAMEQVVPMSLRRPALDAAKECAGSGCMVYMVLSTWEPHRRFTSPKGEVKLSFRGETCPSITPPHPCRSVRDG